jgi:predicted nucleotidyltransferase component of viral defense system
MNSAYQAILGLSDADRRDLFLTTASRVGTTLQNIEKDFWVCWTLDVLFHQLGGGGARLLFKGGTSLSKAYGLIDRFSEDIDVTVFRQDIGEATTVAELEGLGRRPRQVAVLRGSRCQKRGVGRRSEYLRSRALFPEFNQCQHAPRCF